MRRWFGCLHGDSLVTTLNGTKLLRSLRPGEAVLSRGPDGSLAFSPILAFLHREPRQALTFLLLRFAGNGSLAVTPNHLVFRRRKGRLEAVFAGELRPGDRLVVHDRLMLLRSSERLHAHGAFAPMTEAGNLFANGVLVSCYAHITSHSLAHTALLPLRLFARVIGPLEPPQGLSRYAEGLLWLAERLLPPGMLFGS